MSERHARAKEIFLAVCSLPADERSERLEQACGDDARLREDVESLLRHHEDSLELRAPVAFEEPDLEPGDRIARYSILDRLGEGGMGEVWLAEQTEPVRRKVALKLIKAGMDSKQVVARFESERQALALMDHPNIARVFDAGVTEEGRPFFAMEYVKGEPLTTYCDRHRLTTRDRLELFVQVCAGVQHAHQKGVIHRDIKPSNLLVTIQGNDPVPKIIDFGVAKATSLRLTEKTVFTRLGVLIGTPDYMSPEQAEMSGLDVDTRTDVYSLGVVLYELLSGALPLDSDALRSAGLDEIRRRVREDEPLRPSTRFTGLGRDSAPIAAGRGTDPVSLARQLRGELDWIVMRALEKDRTRRYASPAELSADIARHLRHEPVLAGPPSTAYRVRKFVRRHRLGVAAGAAVLLALVAGLVGTGVAMVRAQRSERLARVQVELLQDIFGALDPVNMQGSTSGPEELLAVGEARIERDLADHPLVQAELKATIGAVYRGLGLYDAAQKLLEESLAIREARLAPNDPAILWNRFDLGWLAMELNDYERAAEIGERLLPMAGEILDPQSQEFARLLAGMGMVRWDQQKYDESETFLRRALAIWDRQPDVSDPFFGTALDALARHLIRKGELEQAVEHLERAKTFRQETLGPDHPDMVANMVFLAGVHERLGDHAKALALSTSALELLERTRGSEHPQMVEGLRIVAGFHHRSGELDTARSYYERAVDLGLRVLRPDDQDLPGIVGEYAELLVGLGAYGEVRALHDRVLAFLDPKGGVDHPSYPFVAYRLGELLIDRRAFEEARFYVQRSLDSRERNLDPQNEWIAWTLNLAARIREETGDPERAAAMFERALAIVEQAHGPDYPELSWLLTNLGWNLTRRERFAEARPYHERSVRLVETALGPEHPRMVDALDGLAELDWRTGRYEEARELAERALGIRETEVGREHPDVARRYYNLACISARMGDRRAAMDGLRQAAERGFRWAGIAEDPDLDSLRGDGEFEAVVGEIGGRAAEGGS